MKLSSIQEKIVNTKGNLIVRASAGTGKTHTMVTKISKELNDNKTHKVVAAITFTIKAAQEIKNRLSVDVVQQFIGTNNGFAIEEIIKPFIKDVYGSEFNLDLDTDYSNRVETFEEGLEEIKQKCILSSYSAPNKNFIFELAKKILINSEVCRLYLTSKYFKIYIDEYQDCDKDMHSLFMYICEELKIDMFIVGDEKQSIYMWRGAYPEAFKGIWEKENFEKIFMGDNFRSCQQIQNYTNILCEETRSLYKSVKSLENIIWINIDDTSSWEQQVLKEIDNDQSSALLRFRVVSAKEGASALSTFGLNYVFIPQLPIAGITTETSWLYSAISKFCILEHYSVYDLVSDIPVEADESKKNINKINIILKEVETNAGDSDEDKFNTSVKKLADYLNYSISNEHLSKLYETITDNSYHVAFEQEKYKHLAITFHSSKGLEFDQVILFSEDYRLNDISSIYNHYVASSRAKNKLIIVSSNNYNSRCFEDNLKEICTDSDVSFSDLFKVQ